MGTLNRTPVLLCSLTRTAAAEIAGRKLSIPRQQISTLHSHCYRALGCPQMTEGKADEWNKDCAAAGKVGHMLAESAAVDMDDPDYDRALSGDGSGDLLYNEYTLYRARMVDPRTWRRDIAEFGQRWDAWKQANALYDFTDLIEMARLEGTDPPGNPEVLIADEAQDLSALEYETLKHWGAKCEAMILAGDPYQSLYEWRGACPGIFQDPAVGKDKRRVLSQSYRVSQAVHKLAMQCARNLSTFEPIEYRPTAETGFVQRDSFSIAQPDNILATARRYLDQGLSVMIQVSAGYMLQPLIEMLREQGMPFANPWRRKRGDWNPLHVSRGTSMASRLLAFLRPDCALYGLPDEAGNQGARIWTHQELDAWVAPLTAAGLLVKGAKAELAGLAGATPDVVADLNELGRWFTPAGMQALHDLFAFGYNDTNPDRTIVAADWYVDHALAAKREPLAFPKAVLTQHGAPALLSPPKLFLGTIHSFKGAEADVVICLPDLSYRGKRQWDTGGAAGRDSIIRMFYVAFTRARQGVIIGQPSRYYPDFSPLV
jgi:hypothetical protein